MAVERQQLLESSVLECADKFWENGKHEHKNILCEIIYVVSDCISGENIRIS